jgi:pyridoxamine-phosphate oxidase
MDSRDPLETLKQWLSDAEAAKLPEPTAMTLATASTDGVPAARLVLCRGIDERGVRFFTNYLSRKGREIEKNPRAAAVFFWAPLERQVRIEGRIERATAEESDTYFHGRPRGSQLASAVSPQSQPIANLDELRERYLALEGQLSGAEVPRPAHWGGYWLVASSVELWRGGRDRMHDRVLYTRNDGGGWDATRLAP